MIKSFAGLRFIFAFFIFLHHFSVNGKSIFVEGGNLSVSFFFILSGFVLALSYGDRMSKKEISYKDFVVRRLSKLYPMHWVGFVLAILLSIASHLYNKNVVFSINDLFIGGMNFLLLQSWIPIGKVYFSFNWASWFLSNLLFFYLAFPFLARKIFKNRKKMNIVGFTIAVLVYIVLMVFIPNDYVHKLFYINPLFRLLDFVFGVFLFIVYDRYIKHRSYKASCIISLELFSIIFFAFFVLMLKNYSEIRPYSVFYFIPIALLLLTFAYSEQKGGKKFLSAIFGHKVLIYLGNISFVFFIMHQLVLRFLYMLSKALNISIENLIGFIFALVITMIVSVLTHHYIEKPISKFVNKKLIK